MFIKCEVAGTGDIFRLSFEKFLPRIGEMVGLIDGTIYVVRTIKHLPENDDIKILLDRIS